MKTQQRAPRRVLGTVAAVVGILAILAGVGRATWWRPTDELRATAPASSGADYVVTAPGVLQLGGSVHIHASGGDDETVVVALARDRDVAGWVGDARVTQIDGLEAAHRARFTTRTGVGGAADKAGASAASDTDQKKNKVKGAEATFADSDLWIMSRTGQGTVTANWDGDDRDVVLIAAVVDSDGLSTGSPRVTLSWHRSVTTPLAWPVAGIGLVLLVLGLLVLLGVLLRRRSDAEEPIEEGAETAPSTQVTVTPAPEPEPAIETPEPAPEPVAETFEPVPVTAPEPVSEPERAVEPSLEARGLKAEPIPEQEAPEPIPAPESAPEQAPEPDLASTEVASGKASRRTRRRDRRPVPQGSGASRGATGATRRIDSDAVPASLLEDGQPLTRRRLRELRAQGLLPAGAQVTGDALTGALPATPSVARGARDSAATEGPAPDATATEEEQE